MFILDTITKTLQIELSGAITTNQLPFTTSYVDVNATTQVVTPGAQDGATNNASAVTVMGAPASGSERRLAAFSLTNTDTAPATVTLLLNDNSTLRDIFVITLAVGDNLVISQQKMTIYNSSGQIKTSGSGGGSGTVTSTSVVSANGFAGTVASPTTTPAITISTSVTGIMKGNGTAASAATVGTDYSAGTSGNATGLVKSTTGTGALTTAAAGTDYQAPITLTTTGSSGAATLIGSTLNIPQYSGGGGGGTVTSVGLATNASYLTVTGSPVTGSGTLTANKTIGLTANQFVATPNGSSGAADLRAIVAADIPTLNQNTTGSAGSFTGNIAGDVTGTQGATVVGKINGTSLASLATGILKNTTGTGVPSIAIAADFPTLNQNTTGTAAIANALASATTTVNVSSATAPTTGQVLTATGGTTATWQTPSGGGGITQNNVTGTTQAMAINNGYIANNASLVSLTLPSAAAIGSIVQVSGNGVGGWTIAQNSGQVIWFGALTTTTGTGGSLSSTNKYDCVELICTVVNTGWNVRNTNQGTLTVA